MQPETRFKNKIQPQLKGLRGSWWVKVQQRSIRGTPDILGTIHGRIIALELKKNDKETPSALQQYNVDRINKLGGYAAIVCPENWKMVFNDLREISDGIIRDP